MYVAPAIYVALGRGSTTYRIYNLIYCRVLAHQRSLQDTPGDIRWHSILVEFILELHAEVSSGALLYLPSLPIHNSAAESFLRLVAYLPVWYNCM